MKCNICNQEMSVFAQGINWTYYLCHHCRWYSTSRNRGNILDVDYDEYKTFDANLEHFDSMVKDAEANLLHKFHITGTPLTFLDIGCSEGIFVKSFQNITNRKACGIEVSMSKIQRAKELGLDVDLMVNTKGKFDFILIRHVVEHVENPLEFIANIKDNFLANGGIICIETPNNDHLGARKRSNQIREDRFCRELYPPTHICGFTPKAFRQLVKKLDMKIVYMTTYDTNDDAWTFPANGLKLSFKNRILSHLLLNLNIAIFIK